MQIIELFQKMLQYKSITPNDAGIYDFIEKYLGDSWEVIKIDIEDVTNRFYYKKYGNSDEHLCFAGHIDVANELNKPLIIHTRDARQDTISLLKEHKAPHTRGVLHCFTEDWEMAQAAIELGFYISISGIVTFKSAKELQEAIKIIPMDKLLIETDAPFLAPVPMRGKPNEPSYVKHTAEFLANHFEVDFEVLAKTTTDNFFDLFSKTERPSNP